MMKTMASGSCTLEGSESLPTRNDPNAFSFLFGVTLAFLPCMFMEVLLDSIVCTSKYSQCTYFNSAVYIVAIRRYYP